MQTGNKDTIFVTKSFLPPLREYISYLEKIWDSRWLTNNGPLVQELENKLQEYMGVKHALFISNGTIAIQLALQALDIKGDVITTPFTFVATTTSIIWERCTPVFVDIDPKTLCIDPKKIEKAITEKTQAILAVHVYGYPCAVEEIEKIAKKHHLKVIYDAAHAFDLKFKEKSIFNYGDISTLSMHATKLFHSGEGGLVVTNDDSIAEKVKLLRSFGQVNEENFIAGINGKNSEFHAAMALTNLPHVTNIIKLRKSITEVYRKFLKNTNLEYYHEIANFTYNYGYFPVIFKDEATLLEVVAELEKNNIKPRRYFYPSLNTLPYVKYSACPISESISSRVLCLPLYHDLQPKVAEKIAKIVKSVVNKPKPTLTIGIPAFNEENNILKLIKSIFKQKTFNYKLEEIIVNLDGSTDKTYSIVKRLSSKYRKVKIIFNKSRRGKVSVLNEIYQINKSDYIATFDGDVILANNHVLDTLIQISEKDKNVQVVAAHLIPIKSNSFMGKIIYRSAILWDNIITKVNDGDHIANLFGGASLLKRSFSKSFKYPTHITCDEEFLYVIAKQKGGFKLAFNALVFFKPGESMKDILSQGKRALNERKYLVEYFGNDIYSLHKIPTVIKITESIKIILTDPVFGLLALISNVIIKLIPYKYKLSKSGIWESARSSKDLNLNLKI